MDKLKPCPFCGGVACQVFSVWGEGYRYGCITNGCIGNANNLLKQFKSDKEAIEAWNTRAQQEEGGTMLEMTPEWVIANYENYIKDGCNNIEKELLDLAKRQKAEIERLARENIGLKYDLQVASEESLTVQSESVKRFAETVKMGFRPSIRYNFSVWIDSLLKNRVGDNK